MLALSMWYRIHTAWLNKSRRDVICEVPKSQITFFNFFTFLDLVASRSSSRRSSTTAMKRTRKGLPKFRTPNSSYLERPSRTIPPFTRSTDANKRSKTSPNCWERKASIWITTDSSFFRQGDNYLSCFVPLLNIKSLLYVTYLLFVLKESHLNKDTICMSWFSTFFLQGEVEQIALMKPKAMTENDTG